MFKSARISPTFDKYDQQSLSQRSVISTEDITSVEIQRTLNSSRCEKAIGHMKMILVVVIPLVSMIALSSISLREAAHLMRTTTESIESISQAEQYAELVKMLQRERGRSTMFLSSTSLQPEFLDEVKSMTDMKLRTLPFPSQGFRISDIILRNKHDFQTLLNSLRQNVTLRQIDVKANLEIYTNINEVLIRNGIQIAKLPEKMSIHSAMVTYNSLLQWTDLIGIQRALGSSFFTECALSEDSIVYYQILYGQALSIKQMSITYDKRTEILIDNLKKKNANISSFLKEVYEKVLISDSSELCNNFTEEERLQASKEWFDNMTKFIDEIFELRSSVSFFMKNDLDIILSQVEVEYSVYIAVQSCSVIASLILSTWYFTCLYKINTKISRYAKRIEQKTMDLAQEKKITEKLLHRMLPKNIADTLKRTGKAPASEFKETTVYFSDIVEFTTLSSQSSPMQVVDLLNELYSFFDDCIDKYDVYKVETIGDAYMVASGVPTPNGNAHALHICRMAVDLRDGMKNFQIPHMRNKTLQIRIGIHSGHLVAGVVGRKMPRYCLFGDTVNTASRMESSGEGGKIQISEATNEVLKEHDKMFLTTERGVMHIKGKGKMLTYWLEDYTRPTGLRPLFIIKQECSRDSRFF